MTQRLYATTPANDSVQEIDPFTGTLLRSLFVGGQPNRMAMADTGLHLYVGLDGSAQVVRVSLATFTEDLRFALGNDPFFGPYLPRELAVQPGNPNVLAVVRSRRDVTGTGGVAIYDSGVARPVIATAQSVTELEFSTSTPSRLYGYNDLSSGFDYSRLTVDASGVTLNDETNGLFEGYSTDIRFDNGRMYGSDGRVIDAEARTVLGTIPLGESSGIVAPNSAIGAVHFVTLARFQPMVLRRFDPATFLQVDEDALTGVTMPSAGLFPFSSLVTFGNDGLAFRTEANQVVLIRTGIAVNLPPSITITSPTFAPATTAPGASITLGGTAGGTVSTVTWSTDRGFAGTAAGTTPWYAGDIPLVAGTNVITVAATGPLGTATDTLSVDVSTLSYFMAEGATGSFFDLDVALANPNATPAPVDVTYLREGGGAMTQSLTLPATSRTTIHVNDVAGLPAGALSTVVTSTSGTPLVVERTMRWDREGQYGSHTEKAMTGTGTHVVLRRGLARLLLHLLAPRQSESRRQRRHRRLAARRRAGGPAHVQPGRQLAHHDRHQRRRRARRPFLRHRGQLRRRRLGRAYDVLRHASGRAVQGRPQLRRRERARDQLVPRRGRDGRVLRNVHPAGQPECHPGHGRAEVPAAVGRRR